MKRFVLGLCITLIFGWVFWRSGTIALVPDELISYTAQEESLAGIYWTNDVQRSDTRATVNKSLRLWINGESSLVSWLRPASQWLHQRLQSKQAPTELHRIVRRLIQIRELADNDRAGSASKLFLDEEYRWKERLAKEGESYRDTLRQALYLGYWIFDDVNDQHGAYRIKQQLEDWRLTVSRSETESLSLRLLSLNSRIDESQQALDQRRFEEAELAASVSVQGLNNIAHDMDQLRSRWTEEEARLFGEVWSRMRSQTNQLQEYIALASAEGVVTTVDITTTSTLEMVTSTPSVPTTTNEIPTVPVATTTPPVSTVRRISVIPSSTSLSFGQTISVRAFAINDEGERDDVTPRCQFSATPAGFGQMDKQLFSAFANAGSAVITASCRLEDQTYTGSVTVEVRF